MAGRNKQAFTIVELLVVVVIIGVLSALTLVSYASISRQAVVSSMQSDLSNASTALKAFQAEKGNFPTTISIDCTASPDTNTNKCLKVSGSNSYSNYVASNSAVPKTFSLTVSNPGVTYGYIITSESKPSALSIAPNSPIADWLATLQGDHYGNYYDLVGKTWATVTRAGTKTIFDPQTQHIYDVPANYLAITPRSDGKNGVEAVIEEGRTNLLLNSSFENGLTSWSDWGAPVVREAVSGNGVHGSGSFHITSNASNQGVAQVFSAGTLTIGNTYTVSAYVKVASGQPQLMVSNNSTYPGVLTSPAWEGDGKWHRMSFSFTAATTNEIVYIGKSGSGVIGEYYFDSIQLEQGAFATSYIPTNASTATRNADNVSIPAAGWSANSGTVGVVAADSPYRPSGSTVGRTWYWGGSTGNLTGYSGYTSQHYMTTYTTTGGTMFDHAYNASGGYHTVLGRWNVGSVVRVFIDGVSPLSRNDVYSVAATGMNGTIELGNIGAGANYYGAGIQRLTSYSSALSDANITSVTNAIKDGPQ